MKTLIYNAQIILQHEIIYGYLIIDNGKIVSIDSGKPTNSIEANEKINANGNYVSPGFIELHTHGAGGADFMDCSVSSFFTAAQTHMQHGTTTLLPTTLAASHEKNILCIETFLTAKKQMMSGPNMPGLHMEGPYLNPIYKGAMNESFLRVPNSSEYKELVENYPGAIMRWTVAPELPGALEMGDYLGTQNICASIGHSAADYEMVKKAFYHNYTYITHLFSAMSSIVRKNGFRFPGVQESAFLLENIDVEIIADGCHLPVELLYATWKFKGSEHTVLTCDSMRCAGTEEKTSFLGDLENNIPVIIEDNVAKLLDHSGFGGSIATDDRLVRTMYRTAKIPLTDCIQMMSTTPARIIGLEKTKGSISCGKDADLTIFDEDITIQRVLVNGKTTYRREQFKTCKGEI